MKPLFIILFLMTCTRLSAQEKFIEVTVSDTVLAEAQTFVYELTAGADDDYSSYSTRSRSQRAAVQQNRCGTHFLDSLALTLQKKGFHLLPLSAEDTFMMISMSSTTFSRRFLVHTVDSLSQLFQLIKNNDHLTAHVKAAVAADEAVYQQTLWKKLIAQATDKAEHIAASTHHHITGVLSVTDKPEEKTAGGWTSYPPLSALMNQLAGTLPWGHQRSRC